MHACYGVLINTNYISLSFLAGEILKTCDTNDAF